MDRRTKQLVFTGFFLCILLTACAGANSVALKNYSPGFTADLSEYRGKRIYLMNFSNEARETSLYSYFSRDRLFTYSGDSQIQTYFWYAFEKAFKNLGVSVSSEDKPDYYAPAMWLTLKSVTDELYEAEVKMENREHKVVFKKLFTVIGDPVAATDRHKEYLEKRAYRMTNQLIQAVLTDPGFKNAFLKTAAEMAPPAGR